MACAVPFLPNEENALEKGTKDVSFSALDERRKKTGGNIFVAVTGREQASDIVLFFCFFTLHFHFIFRLGERK